MADYVSAMRLIESMHEQLPELAEKSGLGYNERAEYSVSPIEEISFILRDMKKYMLYQYGREMYEVPDGPMEDKYEQFISQVKHKSLIEERLPDVSEKILPEEGDGHRGGDDEAPPYGISLL